MALTVKIGPVGSEVDRTSLLVWESLRVEQRADSFVSTAHIELYDATGTLDIVEKDSILIEDGATKYFCGIVANVSAKNLAEGKESLQLLIDCQDYNILVEEVVIDQLEQYGGAQDSGIIDDLFDKYLPEINSHTPGGAPPGYVQSLHVFAEIEFEAITLREALDRIATEVESTALAGYWYIDYDKYLHYFNVEDNAPAWSLSDTPDQINSFSYFSPVARSRESSTLTNRILVVGADVALLVQDTDSHDYYGKWFEGVVRDNTLFGVDEVIDHGYSLLAKWAYPDEYFELSTYKTGLRAGMNVEFENSLFGTGNRTNHIKNPSFEVNVTDGWTYSQGGAGGSATRSNTQKSVGSWSCALAPSDAGYSRQSSDNIALADGATITVQGRLYRSAMLTTHYIQIYDVTNVTVRASEAPSSTNLWEVLTVSWTNNTGGAVNISARLSHESIGGTVYWDAIVAEINKGPYSVEYIDGTLPYCDWDGAAHNSTSHRDAYYMVKTLTITWPSGHPPAPQFDLQLGGAVSASSLIKSRLDGDKYGSGIGPVVPGQLPLCSKGWAHDLVFSVTDNDTVAWSAGIITAADTTTFSIAAGNTGNMAAATVYYIYLDIDTVVGALQVSGTGPAVGMNIILIAVAYPNADAAKEATFQVFGGEGVNVFITADNIAANTITANEIAANTITAGQIMAGTITATEIAAHTITANEIAADTITATRLHLGNWDQFFSDAEGLLLLGPGCQIAKTSWESTRDPEATISGAFHQEAGPWAESRGLVVEEAGLNYELAPRMKSAGGVLADGWSYWDNFGSGGSATTTVVAHPVAERGWLQRLQYTAAAGDVADYCYLQDYTATGSFAQGDDVTISVDAKGSLTGCSFRILCYEADAADVSGTAHAGTYVSLSDSLDRIEYTFTTVDADCSKIRVLIQVNLVDNGDTLDVYFGAVNVEKKAYATTFMHGGLDWCGWSGAADQTTTARTATTINPDAHVGLISDNDTLTFMMRARMPYAHDATWPQTNNYLWGFRGADNNNYITLAYNSPAREFYVYINGGWRITNGATQTFAAGDWKFIVVTLDFANDEYYSLVDGVLDGSSTASQTAPTGLVDWQIGAAYYGGSQSGFTIAEYAVLDTVLTANEIAAKYADGKPLADAGAMKKPGIYILDGLFKMASSTSGVRLELEAGVLAAGNPPPTYNVGTGIWLGIDTDDVAKFFIGAAAGNKITWNGTTLSVAGTITIGNPGDIDGSTINNDAGWTDDTTADAANAHRILGITGTWTATDTDTITWAGVVLRIGNGSDVNIINGNTGNMAAKTYIYYNGTTTLQLTTNPNVIGGTHTLVAVAQNGADKANVQIVGGGIYMSGDWINAGTVTAAKLSVATLSAITANMGSLTAGTITGGTIRTAASPAARVEMNASFLAGYSDAATKQFYLDAATGKAYAGGGKVSLDTSGVWLDLGTSSENEVKWHSAGTKRGFIRTEQDAQKVMMTIKAGPTGIAGDFSFIQILADDSLGVNDCKIEMRSRYTGNPGYIKMGAEGTYDLEIHPAYIKMLDDLRVGGGLYVGQTGVDPDPDDVWCDGEVSTNGGTTRWKFYGYSTPPPTPTGYVHVVINGTSYYLSARL